MSQQLHPSLLQQLILSQFRANVASWLLMLCLWTSVGYGNTLKEHWQRAIAFGIGTVAGLASLPLRKMAIALDRQQDDINAISHDAFQGWLVNTMAPSKTVEIDLPAAATLQPFDWNQFRSEPDRFPHLLILGKTGAGKSWLAERLLHYLGDSRLVITPHRKPSDFAGLQVVGGGRDYPAIADMLRHLEREMQRRYEMYDLGEEGYPFLNVVVDEFPAIAANCKGASAIIKTLAMEARKVKIRLLLLCHGDEVKLLGIEGEGSLRESFTYIRLRGFVEDYAKAMKDERLLQWLTQSKYPCMVENRPALGAQLALPPSTHLAPGKVLEGASTHLAPNTQHPLAPRPRAGASDSAPVAPDLLADPFSPEIEHWVPGAVLGCQQAGMTQSEIICQIWGVTKGGNKRYREARKRYLDVCEKLGL